MKAIPGPVRTAGPPQAEATSTGADAALHWFPAGFNADTRTLRITCDSPAWATKLRLEQRQLLTKLNAARPDTVRARELLARHHAAVAVVRGHTVPLRTARQSQPALTRGAA
ncbi:DciA family protein [Kitasatospora sp. NPDC092286]|uniref:DciA family protein n=1 Tax=Kitasatospora sp. NPDC092286 TaxID=3364087 RepID=UPI00380F804C